jgi:acetyl esterase/lipase
VRRRRAPATFTRHVEQYGEHALQVGEWFVPIGTDPLPTVLLLHGGFWGPQYDRHLEEHIATDLADHGYLVWNIDYRSGVEPWPATLSDVAAGYDHLLLGAAAGRVDRGRIAIVGHSAGGHLAAWLASRHQLPPGAPGHNPEALRPALVVPQAGIVALLRAVEQKVGRGAVPFFLGGSPEKVPDRYQIADPMALLPTGVRSVLIHPERDKQVPPAQSHRYVRAATAAGDDSTLVISRGDHFAPLDPKSGASQQLRDALATMTS